MNQPLSPTEIMFKVLSEANDRFPAINEFVKVGELREFCNVFARALLAQAAAPQPQQEQSK